MDTSNPAPFMTLGGGLLLFLASLFDWREGIAALSTDSFGLLGLFALLAGLGLAVVAALRLFAPQVELRPTIAGFRLDQVLLVVAATAFVWTFSSISGFRTTGALHLAWIGAAIATAGCALALRQEATT